MIKGEEEEKIEEKEKEMEGVVEELSLGRKRRGRGKEEALLHPLLLPSRFLDNRKSIEKVITTFFRCYESRLRQMVNYYHARVQNKKRSTPQLHDAAFLSLYLRYSDVSARLQQYIKYNNKYNKEEAASAAAKESTISISSSIIDDLIIAYSDIISMLKARNIKMKTAYIFFTALYIVLRKHKLIAYITQVINAYEDMRKIHKISTMYRKGQRVQHTVHYIAVNNRLLALLQDYYYNNNNNNNI
ncbi:MAG: hypothetical protein QXI43_00185 [Candidatus Nitrosocaldus sp.]